MDISAEDRRRAFSVWLRTGRHPRVRNAGNIELKFNPWHDPENGQFTFAGTGRYFGRGASGQSGGGSEKRSESARGRLRGSGGTFGGGGATSMWGAPNRNIGVEPTRRDIFAPVRRMAPLGRPPVGISVEQEVLRSAEANWRRVVRNGYEYHIDARQRTRRVSGTLTLNNEQRRSRTAQTRAGGRDRRSSDDGGHFIARRFNGPTEAFNHFAQHASFNRGLYRALEDQWARAKRAGRRVTVKIVPVYDARSQRPSAINIWFWIDGTEESLKIPNEPQE